MIPEMERALDALATRQRVVANNIANINTPGFKRSDVDFYAYMDAVFAGSEAGPEAEVDETAAERSDGNTVSLEREVQALTQTDVLFQTVSRLTTQDVSYLRYAITEGRG